jgi:hypothetical protein
VRTATRSAAATALVAGAVLVWAPSPAAAVACSDDSGVTVVVDFHGLGGRGLEQDCVADRGQADELFRDAGHSLENVSGQPFVCRVDALPTAEEESCASTPPSDAYWGLWWSDGTNGTWTYASQGAYALDVPDGGAVAFSWNGTSSTSKPGAAPPKHEEEPSPEPSTPPSGGGGGAGGGTTPDGSTGPTDGASPESSTGPAAGGDTRERQRDRGDGATDDRREKKADDAKRERDRDRDPQEEPGSSATPEADASTSAAEPPADAGGDGLPVWVGPSAAAGALGVAGLAAYLRRRTV